VDPQWWLCRLESLRVQGLHEAYENVALDYCVTYEVSPPSWVEAACTFTTAREPQDGPDSVTGPDSVYSTFGDTRAPLTLELSGEILGDAVDVMRSLSERVHPGEDMVVSCARLIRMDFAAAGSLLNWLSARKPREGLVEFVNVPRLVATFFAVMGVNQHAAVATRIR
jgi:ABC-type transporter Mla MlaB component